MQEASAVDPCIWPSLRELRALILGLSSSAAQPCWLSRGWIREEKNILTSLATPEPNSNYFMWFLTVGSKGGCLSAVLAVKHLDMFSARDSLRLRIRLDLNKQQTAGGVEWVNQQGS